MYAAGPTHNPDQTSAFQPTRFFIGSICQFVCYSAILFCCMSIVGCGPRLAVSRDVELKGGEIKSIIIDAIKSEQTINVEATAEQPFHLHVYLAENEAALDSELDRKVEPTMALAGSTDQTTHKLSASVPGGKEARVRLQSATGQEFSVQLKISN